MLLRCTRRRKKSINQSTEVKVTLSHTQHNGYTPAMFTQISQHCYEILLQQVSETKDGRRYIHNGFNLFSLVRTGDTREGVMAYALGRISLSRLFIYATRQTPRGNGHSEDATHNKYNDTSRRCGEDMIFCHGLLHTTYPHRHPYNMQPDMNSDMTDDIK